MTWLKTLLLFRLMILVIQLQKDCNTKIIENEKKITDHSHITKHIITQEFNRLTAQNVAPRLN